MWINLIIALTTLFLLFYKFWTWNYSQWKRRGIPHLEPKFPFGNTKELNLSTKFIGEVFAELYLQLKGHKYGGYVNIRTPAIILRDPEVIKRIMTRDFHHFTDRGNAFDEKLEPLMGHLFHLNGDKWKRLRNKLSPTFTSGKMKMMFHLMKSCAEGLGQSLGKHAENHAVVDVKDFMARYGTDVIGTCAFGLDIDSINNPDNEFRRVSKEVFNQQFVVVLRNSLNQIFPGLSNMIRLKTFPQEREDFFMKVVRDTVDYREKNGVVRNDFLDLLIQIRNNGKVMDHESTIKNGNMDNGNGKLNGHFEGNDLENSSKQIYMSLESMTAQCFVFFIAGYETSSTTLSFCLYELSLNKSVQFKLREEVDRVLEKHHGEISYESLKEMTYMDKVVSETLRKYPPLPVLTRQLVSDRYVLEDGNLEMKKGERVIIPLFGLHYDPQYYPDPHKFDPDRFNEDAVQSRHNYTWLPFGEGPRICIGMRFGLMQVKTGLSTILSKYEFDRSAETKVPIRFNNRSFMTGTKGGIHLRISKRVKRKYRNSETSTE